MPLAEQPKDIESYDCNDNKVKILRALYDKETGKFWGIGQFIAQITVRDDNDEQFFDYGYDIESETTRLYCKKNPKNSKQSSQHALDLLKTNLSFELLQKNSFLRYFFTCFALLIGVKQ